MREEGEASSTAARASAWVGSRMAAHPSKFQAAIGPLPPRRNLHAMPASVHLGRRSFVSTLGAAAGIGAAALVLGPTRAFAAGARVLLVGDSMIAGAVGIFLERELEGEGYGIKTDRRGKTSSGLARPDFYDWMKEGKKALDASAPEVVVVMFGGNDGQGLWMGKDAASDWIRFEDNEAWTAEYRRRIHEFATIMSASGSKLCWIGMPIVKPSKLRARVAHMNELYRAEMALRDGSEFVDIWDLLTDGEGGYVDRMEINGEKQRVRAGDGIHIAGPGATLIAKLVAPVVAKQLGL